MSKFRTANQNMLGKGQLSNKEKEKYEEAIKEGKGLIWNIYKKLSKEQKQKLKEAKQKKKNNGGLGLQYNLQQQLSSLPKGTILVPMQTQTNKTTSGQEEEQEDKKSNCKSNETRAMNFLQLADGNFVV